MLFEEENFAELKKKLLDDLELLQKIRSEAGQNSVVLDLAKRESQRQELEAEQKRLQDEYDQEYGVEEELLSEEPSVAIITPSEAEPEKLSLEHKNTIRTELKAQIQKLMS